MEIYIALAVVIALACIYMYRKNAQSKSREMPPEMNAESSVRPQEASPQAAPLSPKPAEAPRIFVKGPKLTRDDDAFYAIVEAAVAQTLEAEGINPEGGFVIRQIKPVHDEDAAALVLKDNEALYAVIFAAVARTLEIEGIHPEGGFTIQSIKPVPVH